MEFKKKSQVPKPKPFSPVQIQYGFLQFTNSMVFLIDRQPELRTTDQGGLHSSLLSAWKYAISEPQTLEGHSECPRADGSLVTQRGFNLVYLTGRVTASVRS